MSRTRSIEVGLHFSVQTRTDDEWATMAQRTMRQVALADQRGFSSAVFSEHHFVEGMSVPNPLQLATAAAMMSRRLRVGSNVTLLALQHPVQVAEQASVLDLISDGRAVLGVGIGWLEREFVGFGVPYRQRGEIFERSLKQLRELLAGGEVDDDGVSDSPHRLRGARIHPLRHGGARVAIRVGAARERAVRRAARLADAWVMAPTEPVTRLAAMKPIFDETRAEHGLPPVTEQPMRRDVFVAETNSEAWERFAPGIRRAFGGFYEADRSQRPKLDTIDDIRRWGEGRIVAGTADSVAAELVAAAQACRATEVLVRWRLPGVDPDAEAECFERLSDVVARLPSANAGTATMPARTDRD